MIVKHGKSIEITDQLSSVAATTIAQWIGGYTVIYNQKTIASKLAFTSWAESGRSLELKPVADTAAAHLQKSLVFLKDIPAQIRRNAGAKWFEANQAAAKGIRHAPTVKPKHKKRNCYVTNELFDVQAIDKDRCLIQLKTNSGKKHRGKYLAGVVMPFPKEAAGKALYLSRKGSRFWLSISHDKTLNVMTEDEAKHYAATLTNDELLVSIIGHDLGVRRQVTNSAGAVYHLGTEPLSTISQLENRRTRYQRRYSRMALANDKTAGTKKRKRSAAEKKMLLKISRYGEKIASIKHNNSHHISKTIADNTPLIAAFEDIKLHNMVRRPKAKQCPDTGKWLRNGASAKRGLNRAIHSVNMGQIRQLTAYKLKDRGKLMVLVKPHYSSQECSACGHTHSDNRKTQENFLCQQCGFAAHADHNAALVIKQRGITHVRSESFLQGKTVKTIKVRRKKALELASSGSGDCVSPTSVGGNRRCSKPTIDDQSDCLLEARVFSHE
jgi:putative transposase